MRIEEIEKKVKPKTRFALKDRYGFWHYVGGGYSTGPVNDLEKCDIFRTRLGALLCRLNLVIIEGAKIVKVKVYET